MLKFSLYRIGVKWALGLDTTTDLSSSTEVRKFYILHIYDLSEEQQASDDVAYISKKLLFIKLYIEVLLNQILFIIISKYFSILLLENINLSIKV